MSNTETTMASHIEKITLGISKILESSPGVTEVKFEAIPPAERQAIVSWEQKHGCTMPEDLKNFYLMTDGFLMSWSVKLDDSPIQVGTMAINSISNLTQLKGSSAHSMPNSPTLEDLDDSSDEEAHPDRPHFDSRNVLFELDPCNGNGKVCLVYKTTKPGHSNGIGVRGRKQITRRGTQRPTKTTVMKRSGGEVIPEPSIWFLDRALYWHFLTDTFTAYYRLLLCHQGLSQWQYSFTSYGLSPQAKQWMNMYKPITFSPTTLSEDPEAFTNKLDPNKIFKSKNKTPVTKKKLPGPPAAQKSTLTPSKNPAPPGAATRK
ncbi:PREDICTED: tubulin polyglutamylase complex subunit 2 [Nanorana parkeri]|uniref:tubulin polyglutamylase complex subunit 2 n=1 Tax=Nanorana parkeri TaxID=125878 RepID=UPI00085509F6|nr:PREDICTED: tubulin polyglutamylase complex subunit 2 [Nanorana parkeri]